MDATASIVNHVGALLVVLSAVFLSWLRDISRRRETLLPRLLFSRVCRAHKVGLASRPTIPALQAFRL
jgi:hypothetical protein